MKQEVANICQNSGKMLLIAKYCWFCTGEETQAKGRAFLYFSPDFALLVSLPVSGKADAQPDRWYERLLFHDIIDINWSLFTTFLSNFWNFKFSRIVLRQDDKKNWDNPGVEHDLDKRADLSNSSPPHKVSPTTGYQHKQHPQCVGGSRSADIFWPMS